MSPGPVETEPAVTAISSSALPLTPEVVPVILSTPSGEAGSDAALALQNLNTTNAQISTVQTELNTGLAISTAKDNGAVWAIAQSQRAQVASLGSVTQSLQRGQSAVDVALSAGQTVSGFGWINTSVTNIQTGGAIPTTRNGQLVARLTW